MTVATSRLDLFNLSSDQRFNEMSYLTLRHFIGSPSSNPHSDIFSIEEKIELLLKIAHSIDDFHKSGTPHQNVHPKNILLKHIAENRQFEVLLVESTPYKDIDATALKTLKSMGMPIYRSPEKLNGIDTGLAEDWYNFGIICFDFVFGTHYFGPESLQTIHQRASRKRQPFSKEIEFSITHLLYHLLVNKPQKRLHNYTEINKVLTGIQKDLKTIHHKPPPKTTQSPPIKNRKLNRNKTRQITFLIGATIVAGLLTYSATQIKPMWAHANENRELSSQVSKPTPITLIDTPKNFINDHLSSF